MADKFSICLIRKLVQTQDLRTIKQSPESKNSGTDKLSKIKHKGYIAGTLEKTDKTIWRRKEGTHGLDTQGREDN